MTILDLEKTYLDPGVKAVLDSLTLFPDQIQQAWDEIQRIKIPESLKSVHNIVLVGMGGSALPGEILKDLEFSLLRCPLEIVHGYHLPAYVNQDTLLILASYSGNTEEILSASSEAIRKTKKIFVFATGGKLKAFALSHNLARYDPLPLFNPSGLPRLSLGYSLTTLLALLSRLKLLKLNRRTIDTLVVFLKKSQEDTSLAKKLASSLSDRLPVLVSGAHLVGATVAARNMFHETAKTFAVAYPVPELNHHLLESLSFPKAATQKTTFLLFFSKRYHPEIKRRLRLTAAVLEKRRIPWERIDVSGTNHHQDVYSLIQLLGFVSLYLAALYGVDPTATPWVDWFKKKLEE